MNIPPRALLTLVLLAAGALLAAFGAGGLWGTDAGLLVAGGILLVVGVLLGVSE